MCLLGDGFSTEEEKECLRCSFEVMIGEFIESNLSCSLSFFTFSLSLSVAVWEGWGIHIEGVYIPMSA